MYAKHVHSYAYTSMHAHSHLQRKNIKGRIQMRIRRVLHLLFLIGGKRLQSPVRRLRFYSLIRLIGLHIINKHFFFFVSA